MTAPQKIKVALEINDVQYLATLDGMRVDITVDGELAGVGDWTGYKIYCDAILGDCSCGATAPFGFCDCNERTRSSDSVYRAIEKALYREIGD